jgi:hypothetical protein
MVIRAASVKDNKRPMFVVMSRQRNTQLRALFSEA